MYMYTCKRSFEMQISSPMHLGAGKSKNIDDFLCKAWIYLHYGDILFIFYLYTLFNEGKTHLANIKLFYMQHIYIKNIINMTYTK